MSAQPSGLRRLSRSVGPGVHEKQQTGVSRHPRALRRMCALLKLKQGGHVAARRGSPTMKIVGMIRSTATEEVDAEGKDYVAVRE